MERGVIERTLKEAYAARKRGDLDAITRLFAPDAHFELAGSSMASPVAVQTVDANQFRAALTHMIRVFEWKEQTILSMVIEGDRAAVHWRGKIHSTITDETVDTELVDIVQFKDGRISSFIEFCDTALAARLIEGQPQ
jgi:ketosteroid isomerase-like protein